MKKNSSWSVEDYQRVMVEAYRQQGIAVVMQGGEAFARIVGHDDDGSAVLTAINLTRVSEQFARALS